MRGYATLDSFWAGCCSARGVWQGSCKTLSQCANDDILIFWAESAGILLSGVFEGDVSGGDIQIYNV